MSKISSGWYERNNTDLVIVFVHGLFSNSKICWTHEENKTFWPQLILDDLRYKKPSIYLSSFYTATDSNDYGIKNCATEVLDQLKRQDEDLKAPPLSKQNIVFVTHSTGGIVVRYLLEAFSDDFTGKKIGIALYASPSYGSKLASSFGWCAKLFGNKLASELSWGSSILDDLDGRFITLLERKKLDIYGFEAYENRSPFHIPYMNNSKRRVVEKQSASRYFGNPKLVPKSNHTSIVKPNNKDHFSHLALLDFMCNKEFLCADNENNTKPNILFDQYSKNQEKYYIAHDYDNKLSRALENNSLWVCGPTGVGKTVAIQRAMLNGGLELKYISLGACIDETMGYIFNDILNSISMVDHITENKTIQETIKSIAGEITKHCETNKFCLFVEEIPIKDQNMFIKFSEYIYTLLLLLKEIKNFRLILSSIFEPANADGNELEKIFENFRIIKIKHWTTEDIYKLIEMIESEINIKSSMKEHAEEFGGSPRRVKMHYRDNASTP